MSIHLYHRPSAEDLSLADLTIEDQINIGDGTDTHILKAVSETGLGGRYTIGLDETARTMVICDVGDIDTDFGLSAASFPTTYWMDADGDSHFLIGWDSDDVPKLEVGGSASKIGIYSDVFTDRWLEQDANTFVGIGVAGAGNLAHTSGNEGYFNSAFGYEAARSLTTGEANSFFGHSAARSITTGSFNSIFGLTSAKLLTTGNSNCMFGAATAYSITGGSYNSIFGLEAGFSLTTGNSNCMFGRDAGRYQSDGSSGLQTPENSIYIGASTKSGSDPDGGEDAIDNEIVIGYNATGNGANTVTLGNSSITEFHCQVSLTVDSDRRIKRDITPLSDGLDFINALKPITFRRLNPADWQNKIRPAEYKDREVEEYDEKKKKLKKRIEKALPRPGDIDDVELGLIAQEVEEVLNEQGLDYNIVATNPLGRKSLKYSALVVPLIKAVQELSDRVATLEARRIS